MKEMLTVYLAGGFYSNWRDKIAAAKLGLRLLDPLQNDQSASYRFIHDDLAAIGASNFVIAYYPGGYASHGMAAEIGYAAALKKPIYFIDETGVPDLFLVGLSKRFFVSLEYFITWWRKRQREGKPLP